MMMGVANQKPTEEPSAREHHEGPHEWSNELLINQQQETNTTKYCLETVRNQIVCLLSCHNAIKCLAWGYGMEVVPHHSFNGVPVA